MKCSTYSFYLYLIRKWHNPLALTHTNTYHIRRVQDKERSALFSKWKGEEGFAVLGADRVGAQDSGEKQGKYELSTEPPEWEAFHAHAIMFHTHSKVHTQRGLRSPTWYIPTCLFLLIHISLVLHVAPFPTIHTASFIFLKHIDKPLLALGLRISVLPLRTLLTLTFTWRDTFPSFSFGLQLFIIPWLCTVISQHGKDNVFTDITCFGGCGVGAWISASTTLYISQAEGLGHLVY